MTVPAEAGPVSAGHDADVLLLRQTPQAGAVPAAALEAAVGALQAKRIQPGDFALYVCAIRVLRPGVLYSTAQLAEPAGMTDHQARHAVQRLIAADLVRSKEVWIREAHGAAGNRMRYLLVVAR